MHMTPGDMTLRSCRQVPAPEGKTPVTQSPSEKDNEPFTNNYNND